jgi:acylphosphatase
VSTQDRVARRVVVHGRVQGVFFRDTCRREAESRGVTGWVTNAYDGTVEAVFEGSADAVDDMVAWAKQGPRSATVERVDVSDTDPSGASRFEIR